MAAFQPNVPLAAKAAKRPSRSFRPMLAVSESGPSFSYEANVCFRPKPAASSASDFDPKLPLSTGRAAPHMLLLMFGFRRSAKDVDNWIEGKPRHWLSMGSGQT